jgi:uncharacterized cysteine cluster protein YcgN (CxxCxxCC family)
MSVASCSKCGQQVDTDVDEEFYFASPTSCKLTDGQCSDCREHAERLDAVHQRIRELLYDNTR